MTRKMAFYGLSADRVKRIIRSPKRSAVGVAENTIAVMQPAGSKKNPTEIWAMYQVSSKLKSQNSLLRQGYGGQANLTSKKSVNRQNFGGQNLRKIIISAWRYPGISPIKDEIPIPADIIRELKEEGVIK